MSEFYRLDSGRTAGVIYYVVNVAMDTFQVSETEGGPAVEVSDTGTGLTYREHYV